MKKNSKKNNTVLILGAGVGIAGLIYLITRKNSSTITNTTSTTTTNEPLLLADPTANFTDEAKLAFNIAMATKTAYDLILKTYNLNKLFLNSWEPEGLIKWAEAIRNNNSTFMYKDTVYTTNDGKYVTTVINM